MRTTRTRPRPTRRSPTTTAATRPGASPSDQNFKDCLESWGEIAGGEDIDLFDGELGPQEDEDQTDGGAVGSIDDNPLDVENNDTSDTGGAEDVEDSHDAPFGQLSWGDTIAVTGLCSVSYTMCLLACELEAFGG
jgi:hypothetical protein